LAILARRATKAEGAGTREHLPIFSPAPADEARAARGLLRIDGLVAQPLELSLADLRALPRIGLDEAFVCEEGWTVPGLRWRGIRLADVLALAQPLAG
jgi:DMSO/TMAO reductase YedYZ molybdopterin-dependent catalytic subunit